MSWLISPVVLIILLFAQVIMSGRASEHVPASHIRSFGLLYLTLIALIVAADRVAWHSGIDDVGVVNLGFGFWFLCFTIFKEWAFWNHPLSLFWRTLLGERWTRVAFSGIGIAFILIGGVDIRAGLQDVERCRKLLASATNVHERMRALYAVPGKPRGGAVDPMGLQEPALSCERYGERGASFR